MVKGLGLWCKNLFAYIGNARVLLPLVLIVGYAAGILSALIISGSHPVAAVHQGRYVLTGVYKGQVYELIPLEESVRLRQKGAAPQNVRIRKIGSRNPVIEDLVLPTDSGNNSNMNGTH
ncbi:MAG: hypothetical protein GTO40_02385 [Deltaproteobacteria bacterium]|nr:hypothetical protein [Deltaproteobacteria bacterium]